MIINYVAKTLLAALDWDYDMQAAAAAPNLGNRSGPTEIEQGSAYEALAPALRERGHEVSIRELPSGSHGIERVPGGWRGGADPRRDGTAKGD
jgi:gamma-glutamyltranspeptidase/glutathione hydrolase